MRRASLAAGIFVVGSLLVVFASTSCGTSASPGGGGGTSGIGSGVTMDGGEAGSKESGGTGGTGGTMGAGGTSGTGAGEESGVPPMSSGPQDASTVGLEAGEFTAKCKSCLADMCFDEFQACETTRGCIAGVNCVANCYAKTGSLISCGTVCHGDASSAVVSTVTAAVVCAANYCGTGSPPACPVM